MKTQTKRNQKTTMQSAFEKAGLDGDIVALESLVDRVLGQYDFDEAINVIGLEIIKSKNLLRVLVRLYAEPRRVNGLRGEDHTKIDDQVFSVQTTQLTPLPGEGHMVIGAHAPHAQPRQPHDSGGGQEGIDTHSSDAPSAVAPARGLTAIAAIQGIMAKHIVFKLRDGRDIMDAQFHELPKIENNGIQSARQYTREALVAKYLREHVTYANPDPFSRIGDLFPQKTLELAIIEAEKETVHA